MTNADERTLNEVLARLGWRTEPYILPGRKKVYDEDGKHVGNLTAGQVWDLLEERGLVLEQRGDHLDGSK